MTIEIHQPELEALIAQRLHAGRFETVEQTLIDALRNAPPPALAVEPPDTRTGADLFAALRNSPFYGLEIDFESGRAPIPVREVKL